MRFEDICWNAAKYLFDKHYQKKVREKPSVTDFINEYLISTERKHSKGSLSKCVFNNLILL